MFVITEYIMKRPVYWLRSGKFNSRYGQEFFFPSQVHTDAGVHPASYSMRTEGVKRRSWSWLLTSSYDWGWKWVELYCFSSCMTSLCEQGNYYLHMIYLKSLIFNYCVIP